MIARAAMLRFSTLGIVSVGTLLVTGIVNTWYLAGSIEALTGTYYGQLLLAKIALFFAMVAIAAVNRQWLTPRLCRTRASTERAQRRDFANCAATPSIEALAGAVIICIVAVLGTKAAREPCQSPSGLWRRCPPMPPSCTSTPNRPWPTS